MTEAKMSPLRRRMVEDMQIRGLEATTQASYLRAVEAFAGFLGRSPDTATPAELRAWQEHMARTGVSIPIYNHRITVLRFFFSVTCGRDALARPLRFRRAPRKLPEVLSPHEAARLLDAAPRPGLNLGKLRHANIRRQAPPTRTPSTAPTIRKARTTPQDHGSGAKIARKLEWAPGSGHYQAADLTVGRGFCSSNCIGLR